MGSKVPPPTLPDVVSGTKALAEAGNPEEISDRLEAIAVGNAGRVVEILRHPGQGFIVNYQQSFPDTSEEPNGVAVESGLQASSHLSSEFDDWTEDEKLKKCFLYAMKRKIKSPQLPMLTSAFFRDCVIACWWVVLVLVIVLVVEFVLAVVLIVVLVIVLVVVLAIALVVVLAIALVVVLVMTCYIVCDGSISFCIDS